MPEWLVIILVSILGFCFGTIYDFLHTLGMVRRATQTFKESTKKLQEAAEYHTAAIETRKEIIKIHEEIKRMSTPAVIEERVQTIFTTMVEEGKIKLPKK